MELTRRLKQWLVENCDVPADAEDTAYRDALAKAIAGGELSPDKIVELSKEDEAKNANVFLERMEAMAKAVEALAGKVEAVTKEPEKKEEKKEAKPETKVVGEGQSKASRVIADQGGTPDDVNGEDEVRVKRASESYESTRKGLVYPERTKSMKKHPFAGDPVRHYGTTLNDPSDQDKAFASAWAKFQIATSLRNGIARAGFEALSEHEKDLLTELCESGLWDASKDKKPATMKGFPGGIKALIDDATSGGTEAAPIVFDDLVIQAPLLHGELFPLVNTIPIDRGRRIEGVSTGTVTGSWGGVDASSISLFATASYVSAFDTTIYRWEGAIEIGLDFLSDTPIDFGAHITAQYGERLMEDLDDVIAVGDGTTQPEGVMNKSGATSVSFSSATSIGNYESLRFGVALAEHKGNVKSTAVFCGNETSYQRARAIPVGAADARRIFGLNYDSYSLMERPYKINESLANTQLFYAMLGRYRMYRRRGLAVSTTTEGSTLKRANEMLIVAMARYGGQMERGAACAVVTDAPA